MSQKSQFRFIVSPTSHYQPPVSSPAAVTPPLPLPTSQATLSSPPQTLPPLPPILPTLELDSSQALPAISEPSRKKKLTRIIAAVLTLALAGVIAYIWFSPSAATTSTSSLGQQNFNTQSANGTPTGGVIHVYVVGAVKNPGVYTLPQGARVYELLQAAGGPLPDANLVALNLAAPLTDGQEVYVIAKGEAPPTYLGGVPGPGANGTPSTGNNQLVNINTASADEMRQALHISSATAQKIIDYRNQHGPYTSVDQLLQVVSRSIYDKIKNLVTV